MRSLTAEEQATLDRRSDNFPHIVNEIRPSIVELAEYSGYPHPRDAVDEMGRSLVDAIGKLNLGES